MSYSDFAMVLSGIDIAIYLVLMVLAGRRAHFRDRRRYARRESIALHARFFEGPVLTMFLFAAILTGAASLFIGSADYVKVAALAVAATRGGLFAIGGWLLRWYWLQRSTWR